LGVHPACLEFRILGPVEVIRDGVPIPLDGSKQRTVLVALLLADGRMLSDSQLSYFLWGEHPPNTVNAQIYTYVSRLRKSLGSAVNIQRRRPGYTMNIGAMQVDFVRFEQLARIGQEALRAGQYESAADTLRAALSCWRGPALADVTEFLADAELHRLEESGMVALEGRVEADLALGRHGALIPELTGLAITHPLRERLRAQLMVALYRVDRPSDALAAYHDGRRILAEEIGSDPGTTLAAVYHAILAGEPELLCPAGAAGPAVPGRTYARPPAMLPRAVPDFTGREPELDRILRVLANDDQVGRHRIPVVSGMAGSGKTALAVHAAHALRQEFPDGQLYAELGGTSVHPADPANILGWFLRALKVDESAIPAGVARRSQLFRSRLVGHRILLLLDNAVCDRQVRPLLPSGSDCRVIVTSRTRLAGLEGAELIDLEPMAPENGLAVLRKMIGADRVAADPVAARRVVDLCGRLPLGLRIVAVRLAAKPHWTLARLVERLEDERARLGELSAGALDLEESLRASYRRVAQQARLALRQLSHLSVAEFPAWTVAAVLRVPLRAGEEIAESLVDARLLEVRSNQMGRPRYRFHSLVRLFARAQPTE
jgi:DNA-binding SARP family transcriptional activator